MKKLRLLITKECNRNCPGCCNKDWNLDELPICTSFEGYDEVLLTGGEPYLVGINPFISLIHKIRSENNTCKIFVYSAHSRIIDVLDYIDGLTFTLHDQKDVPLFDLLNLALYESDKEKSLRLNIFKGIKLPDDIDLSFWKVKKDMEWIKNCPLPKDEVFMRLQ